MNEQTVEGADHMAAYSFTSNRAIVCGMAAALLTAVTAPLQAASGGQLQSQTVADGSASIGLAPGWHVEGGRGAVRATGPSGEVIGFNIPITLLDPDVGAVSQTLRAGGVPPGVAVLAYRDDPLQAFFEASNFLRKQTGEPPLIYHVLEAHRVAGGVGVSMLARGTEDFQDGKGTRNFVRTVTLYPRQGNGIDTLVYAVQSIPQSVEARDKEVIAAMARSYRVDPQVIQQIMAQDTRRARQQGAASVASNTAARNAGEARFRQDQMDTQRNEQDIQHGGFGQANSIAGQTSVLDMQTGGHHLVDVAEAEAMIHANPSRYRELSAYEYLPGERY